MHVRPWLPQKTIYRGAQNGNRLNAIAPGSLHAASPGHSEGRDGQPITDGLASTVKDVTDAVMYLTDAATVTGHILYVDRGAHFGRW